MPQTERTPLEAVEEMERTLKMQPFPKLLRIARAAIEFCEKCPTCKGMRCVTELMVPDFPEPGTIDLGELRKVPCPTCTPFHEALEGLRG